MEVLFVKKKIRLISMVVLMLFVLSNCAQKTNNAPLRLCVDLRGMNSHKLSEVQGAFERFIESAKEKGGPNDVLVEVIPYDGVERETTVDRLRTEIMAGEGPDIFIATSSTETSLFRYPETAMKGNLLLPLNDWIESAQYMEWDYLNQNVMSIGSYDGNQYLIPLDYSFSVTIYRENDITHNPSKDITWMDVVSDSSNVLPASANYMQGTTTYNYDKFISGTWGELADFSKGELLFSEEELLNKIQQLLELNDRDYSSLPSRLRTQMGVLENAFSNKSDPYYTEIFSQDEPLTIVPMYQDKGGVTAIVTHFAGINRNTKNPEKAFKVLDLLLSQESQQYSDVYKYITDYLALPVDNRLLSPDTPVFHWNWSKSNFNKYCELRDQITCVRFDGVLERYLSELFWNCYVVHTGTEEGNISDLVHETYRIMKMDVAES